MDRWGYPHGLESSRWFENPWYSDKRWKLVGTRDFFHWVFLWSLQPKAALPPVQADVLLHTSQLLGLHRDIYHECWCLNQWSCLLWNKLKTSLVRLESQPAGEHTHRIHFTSGPLHSFAIRLELLLECISSTMFDPVSHVSRSFVSLSTCGQGQISPLLLLPLEAITEVAHRFAVLLD